MKQEDEHIMYMDDDYTFRFIFLLKTTPEEWLENYIVKKPEFKLLIDKIKRTTEISFSDLFEYHFKIWEKELQNKNDDLIK
ncbi:MAG: hypothetical protein J7L46_04490, partial [Bacteroidales bacterium]|nr:hypothetical protein [Bacteroidales bacterium]